MDYFLISFVFVHFLGPKDLCDCARVCKAWNEFSKKLLATMSDINFFRYPLFAVLSPNGRILKLKLGYRDYGAKATVINPLDIYFCSNSEKQDVTSNLYWIQSLENEKMFKVSVYDGNFCFVIDTKPWFGQQRFLRVVSMRPLFIDKAPYLSFVYACPGARNAKNNFLFGRRPCGCFLKKHAMRYDLPTYSFRWWYMIFTSSHCD